MTNKPTDSRIRIAGPISIVVLCAVIAVLRWVVLDNLITTDPPMWLYQSARYAWGEFPYRDFSYNYSPLSLLAVGSVLRWFGVQFWVAALMMDLLAALNVLVAYRLARRLMPPFFAWVSMVFLVGICTTSLTKYNLFSFSTYSPSLLFASLGLLMVTVAGLDWLRGGPTKWRFLELACGSFLAMTSKQEALATTLGALMLLAMLDWKSRSGRGLGSFLRLFASLFLVCGLPAAIVYIVVAREAGIRSFLDGLGGYGLASVTCPWWPTGYGALGGLAALGNAAVLLLFLSLPFRSQLPMAWRAGYRRLLWFLPIGLIAWITYLWLQNRSVLNWPVPLTQRLLVCVPTLLWTNPVLLMVMWPALLLTCYLLWDWARRRREFPSQRAELLFIISLPVAISLRGLFLTTLTPITEVSALCYPFFCVIGPYLLFLVAQRIASVDSSQGPERVSKWKPQTPFAAALLLYAVARFAGSYGAGALQPSHWQPLQTEAGTVRLGDHGASADAYRYVMEHSRPDDFLTEIPYGGGLGFAAHRRPALFTNQFNQLKMSRAYQLRDVSLMEQRKPTLVVVVDKPGYGTEYGIQEYLGCPCPRLVWKPDQPSWIPGYVFPIAAYIEGHYKPAFRFGRDGLIMTPDSPAR